MGRTPGVRLHRLSTTSGPYFGHIDRSETALIAAGVETLPDAQLRDSRDFRQPRIRTEKRTSIVGTCTFRVVQTAGMAKNKRKRNPKTTLKLPDLEQSKSAVLNSLTSRSSQRSYDHAIREFIDWYCSEPRLAFNKTVVTRYRIRLGQEQYASSTINLRLAAIRMACGLGIG